jgi:hypothetical protein
MRATNTKNLYVSDVLERRDTNSGVIDSIIPVSESETIYLRITSNVRFRPFEYLSDGNANYSDVEIYHGTNLTYRGSAHEMFYSTFDQYFQYKLENNYGLITLFLTNEIYNDWPGMVLIGLGLSEQEHSSGFRGLYEIVYQ